MKRTHYVCESCKKPEPARLALGIEVLPKTWITIREGDSSKSDYDFCSWKCVYQYVGSRKV